MSKSKRRLCGTYVSPNTEARLKAYCAATHTTESAVIEAALVQYLTGTSDHTALFRRLDRLDRVQQRMHRDAIFYGESFAEFLRVWYAYTPELPESSKPIASQQSARRFQAFVRQLSQRLGTGRSLIDELVGDDPLALPRELERARESIPAE